MIVDVNVVEELVVVLCPKHISLYKSTTKIAMVSLPGMEPMIKLNVSYRDSDGRQIEVGCFSRHRLT